MIEKINETAIVILDRIKKAVEDETKSITPENLKIMSEIISIFDFMITKREEPNTEIKTEIIEEGV